MADNYLEADPVPITQPQPSAYLITIDSNPQVVSPVVTNADGSVQLKYDLTTFTPALAAGTHQAVIQAVNTHNTLESPSAPVTFVFTIGALPAPTGIVITNS